MDCRKYRQLLYLNREGELSSDEEKELASHVLTCAKCAKELNTINEAERTIRKVRSATPSVPNAEELVAAIMKRVRAVSGRSVRSRGPDVLERVLEFIDIPAVRLVTAVLIAVAVTAFLYQEFAVLDGIQALEQKLAAGPGLRLVPEVSYSISGETVRRNPDLQRLRRLLPGEHQKDDLFLISKRTLESATKGLQEVPFEAYRLQKVLGMDREKILSTFEYLRRHAVIRIQFEMEGT